MGGMPWVKIYTEILNDVKLSRLEDAQKWRFVQFILLAAECDAEGYFVTGDSRMNHEDMCWKFRCDIEILQKDIIALKSVSLLAEDDEGLYVKKFSDRQGPTQEEKRKQWAARQRKKRELAKNHVNVTGDTPVTHPKVTPLEEEEEEELKTISSPSGDKPSKEKPKTQFVMDMEKLEKTYAEARGCDLPDWDKDPKVANKRWRTPLGQIYNQCEKDLDKAKKVIEIVTKRMKDDGLTFDAPDQILKTASSFVIDMKNNVHSKASRATAEW